MPANDLQGSTVLCVLPADKNLLHNQSTPVAIFVYKSAEIIFTKVALSSNSEDLLFETLRAFTKCTAYLIFSFVRYILSSEKYSFQEVFTSSTVFILGDSKAH